MRLSLLSVATLAVALLGTTAASGANAQIKLSPRGCQTYAAWSGNLVWARDLGADLEKARADLVAHNEKRPSSFYALMLNQLDALWTTSATWEDVTAVVFNDCVARRGLYQTG